jgi:tRNA threonylcarbamoyladenosine biosynthesis protein TsaE
VSWSSAVPDLDRARAALARPGEALDLRAAAVLDQEWAALGFRELVPGELVRPVDVVLPDLAATRALGARIARALRPGDLVVLSGPLGAGKTSLTQGLAGALAVRGTVTSPTFVLARSHRGPLPLLHVDAYRLRPAGARALDLADLDLEDALDEGVVVVEWGEGLVEELSESRLHVVLSRPQADGGGDAGPDGPTGPGGVTGPADVTRAGGLTGRRARVEPHGPRWSLAGSSAPA